MKSFVACCNIIDITSSAYVVQCTGVRVTNTTMTDVRHMVSHCDYRLKLPRYGIIVLEVGYMHLRNNRFL
jgi:hypothetical protein